MGLIDSIERATHNFSFRNTLAIQALAYGHYDLAELLGWQPSQSSYDSLTEIGDISFGPRRHNVALCATLYSKMIDLYLEDFAQLDIQHQYRMCRFLYGELLRLKKVAVTMMCYSRSGGRKNLVWNKQDILMARDLIECSGFSLPFLVALRIVYNVFLGQWSDEGLKLWACRLLGACGCIFGYSITQIAYILAKFVDDTTLVRVFLTYVSRKKCRDAVEVLQGLRKDMFWNDIVDKSIMLSPVDAYTIKTVFAALAQHQEPANVYSFLFSVPSLAVRRMVYLNPAYDTSPEKLVNILHTDYKKTSYAVTELYWSRALLHPNCPKDFYLELLLQNDELLRQLGQYFLQKKTLAA